MADKSKPDDKLVDTGKPDDPAKKDNPDTREEQMKPFQKPDEHTDEKNNADPALETTRKAGQGGG